MSLTFQSVATTDLLTIFIVLAFPGCNILLEITRYISFSVWILSLMNMNLMFVHFITLVYLPIFSQMQLFFFFFAFAFAFFCHIVAYGSSQTGCQMGAAAAGLYHSSQQCWILNPLSDTKDRTHIPMDTGWAYNPWNTTGTPQMQHCLDSCSSKSSSVSSPTLFSFNILFASLSLLLFYINFRISFLIVTKWLARILTEIESIDQVGKSWHLTTLSLPKHECGIWPHSFSSSLISFIRVV